MRTATLLIGLMTVLAAVTFLPASTQANPVCAQGNKACVCTNCKDSATQWDCVAGVGVDNSSIVGVVCTPPPPPPGNGTGGGATNGISHGVPCDGITTFTYASNGNSATFSQAFVSPAASPNVGRSCVGRAPTYTTDDSDFAFDGRTLLIRHVSQDAFGGASLETTSVTFTDGGAAYEQRFTDLKTGETTWESSGFLAGAFVPSYSLTGSEVVSISHGS